MISVKRRLLNHCRNNYKSPGVQVTRAYGRHEHEVVGFRKLAQDVPVFDGRAVGEPVRREVSVEAVEVCLKMSHRLLINPEKPQNEDQLYRMPQSIQKGSRTMI